MKMLLKVRLSLPLMCKNRIATKAFSSGNVADDEISLIKNISKIDKSVYIYLKNSNILHKRMSEEVVDLSYRLGEEGSESGLIKNEILRLNKQLNNLNNFMEHYNQYADIIKEILNCQELIKEATELNEVDMIESAQDQINEMLSRIPQIREEVVNSLISEEKVS